jgi:protein SCO1
MNRWIVPIMLVALVGLVLSIIGLVTVISRAGSGPGAFLIEPEPAAIGLSVPEFRLIDHAGREQTEAIFQGRITILDFIFTHCPFACPMMTGAMSELSGALRGSNVQFVSISVDPDNDTPERLREYAARYQADLGRWMFLTGDRETIHQMVMDSLKFALQVDESQQIPIAGSRTMSNIVHPTKLLLIGPDRRVLGMFEPNSEADIRRLEAKARAAAKNLPRR